MQEEEEEEEEEEEVFRGYGRYEGNMSWALTMNETESALPLRMNLMLRQLRYL